MSPSVAQRQAPKMKTAFKKGRVLAPLHTSGPVALTTDGLRIVTCVGEEALFTDVRTGETICKFRGDTTPITALTVSPSGRHLLVFYTSLALRIYELPAAPSRTPLSPIRHIARAHDAPVHVCAVDPTSTLLASGAADGVVKVWDILQGYVTHSFRGHGGVVSALCFNFPALPAGQRRADGAGEHRVMQLITGSVDTKIRIFDLGADAARAKGRGHEVLEGHVSVVRGLDVSADGRWLVSGGRDSVVLVWDISRSGAGSAAPAASRTDKKGKGKQRAAELVKTIPVLERVEAVGILHGDEAVASTSAGPGAEGRLRFWTGGEQGVARVWDATEGRVLLEMDRSGGAGGRGGDGDEQHEIVHAIYNPATSSLVSIHADQNIIFHSLRSGSVTRQLIGFNDEIVDAVFLSPPSASGPTPDSHLALATNSSLIRVYSTRSFDARLLAGHTDMVLCLARSAGGRLLASGAKDKTARLWALTPSNDWRAVALCEGHAESVGAVALARTHGADGGSPRFMFTGSQDRTIKMWDLGALASSVAGGFPDEPLRPRSLVTHKAHEKDINALDVAPNDRLLASGSQDRTVKVFQIEYASGARGAEGDLKLLGVCKGHKRGVWTVRFGRTDRVLASGSGDKSVRLWSLDDFSCLKTFEGHTNSVLRVDFLSMGMQLVSTASDGLVKLWNVKEEECVASLDNHEDRVWALAISHDESTIVSAGADSVATFWEDCTEEQEREKEVKRIEDVAHEQDFLNYVSLKDYRAAIVLALAMDQPKRLLTLFTTVNASRTADNTGITGSAAVDQVIRTLGAADLVRLLKHVRAWNATARTSPIAQLVLHAALKLRTADDIAAAFGAQGEGADADEPAGSTEDDDARANKRADVSLRELIDGLLPYTERHYARAERLVQDSYVVDHVLGQMDDWLFEDEVHLDS